MTLRSIAALSVVLMASTWAAPVRADEGGSVDPATGLVWSKTLAELGQGSTSRKYSLTYAASYSVWDDDEFGVPTLYADWWLPTVAELRGAIRSSALDCVLFRNPDGTIRTRGPFHTSEGTGKKMQYVEVVLTADRMAVDVAASGRVIVGGDMATMAVMVRP